MPYRAIFTTTRFLQKAHNLNSLPSAMRKYRYRRICAKSLNIVNKEYQSGEVSPNVKSKRY